MDNIGLNIKIGDWFIADIIGHGIYQLIDAGINQSGRTYAIVRLKKMFGEGFTTDIGHETTCHPIDVNKWNQFKIIPRKLHPSGIPLSLYTTIYNHVYKVTEKYITMYHQQRQYYNRAKGI